MQGVSVNILTTHLSPNLSIARKPFFTFDKNTRNYYIYFAHHKDTSFIFGNILITSPDRVLTTMLLPTASSTSMDSVFLKTSKIQKRNEEQKRNENKS